MVLFQIAVYILTLFNLSKAQEAGFNDYRIEFIGSSGGLKFFHDSNPDQFLKVTQSQFEEVDSEGNRVGGVFSPAAGDWTDVVVTSFDNGTSNAATCTYYKTKDNVHGFIDIQ